LCTKAIFLFLGFQLMTQTHVLLEMIVPFALCNGSCWAKAFRHMVLL
jgi:hypothetical protein